MNRNNEGTYKVLNPLGEAKEAEPIPLAPRVPDLSGKVVYCISQYVGGADIFISKVASILPRIAPGVTAVYKRKPGAYMSDDPDLWEEVSEKADAVIYGCGA